MLCVKGFVFRSILGTRAGKNHELKQTITNQHFAKIWFIHFGCINQRKHNPGNKKHVINPPKTLPSWWQLKYFLIFIPTWGRKFPIWLIFFRMGWFNKKPPKPVNHPSIHRSIHRRWFVPITSQWVLCCSPYPPLMALMYDFRCRWTLGRWNGFVGEMSDRCPEVEITGWKKKRCRNHPPVWYVENQVVHFGDFNDPFPKNWWTIAGFQSSTLYHADWPQRYFHEKLKLRSFCRGFRCSKNQKWDLGDIKTTLRKLKLTKTWWTLPETNSSPLKIGLPNGKVVFQPSIFRGDVSFREGKLDFSY